MIHRVLSLSVLAVVCLTLSAPQSASANDASFGGSGAALVPLKETRVKMLSEDIVLDRTRGDDQWHVKATYRFKNPTAKTVKLQIGFPEQHCDPEMDCFSETSGVFHGLETRVRGQKVKLRKGKVGADKSWAPSLGHVHLFDVTFKGGEELEIVHTYSFDRTVGVGSEDIVFYVTRTGALWNGPIGRARFTVRLPYRPWASRPPKEYKLKHFEEKLESGKPVSTLVFEMTKWTPSEDFEVNFDSGYLAIASYDCPAIPRVLEDASVLEGLNKEGLRRCRNLPYAKHGYAFRSKDLREYFYGSPTTEDVTPFAPNPNYSPKLMTAKEQRYVVAIKKEEKRRAK